MTVGNKLPLRFQRKREKGWRKPKGAIDVTRPGRWGNPFKVIYDTAGWWALRDPANGICHASKRAASGTAVEMFREEALAQAADIRAQLAGRDLMCHCHLCPDHAEGKPAGVKCEACDPCHADVLLEIANLLVESAP